MSGVIVALAAARLTLCWTMVHGLLMLVASRGAFKFMKSMSAWHVQCG